MKLLLLLSLLASPIPITPITVVDDNHEPKWIIVTPAIEAKLKADPVYRFIQKVNDAATKKPYWSQDYRRAFYDSFQEEASKCSYEIAIRPK